MRSSPSVLGAYHHHPSNDRFPGTVSEVVPGKTVRRFWFFKKTEPPTVLVELPQGNPLGARLLELAWRPAWGEAVIGKKIEFFRRRPTFA